MRIATCMMASVCTLISGCADLPGKVSGSVADADGRATLLAKSVGSVEKTAAPSPVSHLPGVWLSTATIKLDKQEALPAVFSAPATFDRSVISLSEFAERITLHSGVPTNVSPDAVEIAAAAIAASSAPASTTPTTIAAPSVPTRNALVPALAMPSAASARVSNDIRIVYPRGTLSGLLDTAASRFGVSWKYADGSIQFFHTDIRTFQISAIPGDSALSATVASGSTAGGGGVGAGTTASNSQNTAVRSALSVFGSIERSISTMLTSAGKVVASPATGTITVSDTPSSLARIAHFVENENKALSRQVMINVTVLAVNLSDAENYGINWNLVYGNLLSRYGIQNTFAATPGSTSFSAAILGTASSKFAGSSVVIDALSNQGRVRRETTASVVTLNNQPVPVQVAKQTSYLLSSQTTVTASVGTTTTLTPGNVTSGFNMTILPHVLASGTVMMQFSTDISSLRRIRTVTSNSSSIESPELDTRNFLQRVSMRSGETLVVSGFEQLEDDLDQQGVGKPTNMLLGGGYKAKTGKEVIVILITPIVMGNV